MFAIIRMQSWQSRFRFHKVVNATLAVSCYFPCACQPCVSDYNRLCLLCLATCSAPTSASSHNGFDVDEGRTPCLDVAVPEKYEGDRILVERLPPDMDTCSLLVYVTESGCIPVGVKFSAHVQEDKSRAVIRFDDSIVGEYKNGVAIIRNNSYYILNHSTSYCAITMTYISIVSNTELSY